MMEEICKNCKFGNFPEAGKVPTRKGFCRRNAPQIQRAPNTSLWYSTIWPRVWDDDFCGEFQPRTTQDEA